MKNNYALASETGYVSRVAVSVFPATALTGTSNHWAIFAKEWPLGMTIASFTDLSARRRTSISVLTGLVEQLRQSTSIRLRFNRDTTIQRNGLPVLGICTAD